MLPAATLRIARTHDQLDRLLDRIESGELPKPDWIRLESRCRLSALPLPERKKRLARLHRCVLRGFRDVCPAFLVDPSRSYLLSDSAVPA